MQLTNVYRTTVFVLCLVVQFISLSAQPSYENYSLVWSDEFSGSGLPDATSWGYEKGCSVRNSELQNYTERRLENARVEGGNLIIEARKEVLDGCNYTAASLITRGKREFQYGIFEMRAKIDVRKGSWPAFWTLGVKEEWPSNGEIDIMEYYNGQLHANVAWGTDTRWSAKWDSQTKTVTSSFSDDYHIWRMHWTEDFIKLYVDSVLQNSTDLATTINGSLSTLKNPFHQKVYIVVNQAIGANGGDPAGTQFPVTYLVDYVRVYQEGADTTPPVVVSVSATVNGTVTVVFSEQVEKKSAETVANFSVNRGASAVTSALLQSDGKTVVLAVPALTLGSDVVVEIASVNDGAQPPNRMAATSKATTVVRESVKLAGTVVGGGEPWNGTAGAAFASVLDGAVTTFADCTGEEVWAGYDFGTDSLAVVTAVRYYPRSGYANRMNGRTIEVSSNGMVWEKVHAITSDPAEGTFTREEIAVQKPVRFVRYNGTGGYLNVAEVEFWGYRTAASSRADGSFRRSGNLQRAFLRASAGAVVKVYTLEGKLLHCASGSSPGVFAERTRLLRAAAQGVYIVSAESAGGTGQPQIRVHAP